MGGRCPSTETESSRLYLRRKIIILLSHMGPTTADEKIYVKHIVWYLRKYTTNGSCCNYFALIAEYFE